MHDADWRGPGSYALVMQLGRATSLRVGRLGTFVLQRGFYVYLGSALGSGGLAARLARHRRHEKRRRWHVDYMLDVATLCEMWAVHSTERWECRLAWAASELEGAQVPVPGFGSSDCRCAAHLVYLAQRPGLAELAGRFGEGGLRMVQVG